MKNILLLLAVVLLLSTSAFAQKKNAKVSFEVDGVCMMCKQRIEKAALKTKGVKFAKWDVNTHKLSLIIDERKTTAETVKKSVAGVGHDTKEFKATKEAYDNLHECCKYRDEEVQEDHKKPKK
ncbi:heavy-metal-associated domain-containing protein [Tenacibaculum sp. 1B UA]|uniref:heavy-metal-associated domain-containing protein n=1 Tax=Tenacibaculum sp. 1B UA TaxID=2922252 RepID=UPI002A241314|nr:heavy-metal-associated domain-containing protein [Tenacibaculum sp. 1B UA]MDX8554342.1 heavy-metal-associated domain-containing protein [Tenacibaculum sp. 1B UA]